MARWLGFELQTSEVFLTQTGRTKLTYLQAMRIGFFSSVLAVTVFLQIRQPQFIGYSVTSPLLAMLSGVFLVNSIYTYFLETFEKRLPLVTAILYALDTVFITGLVYYTEFNQSIFLFMYLINIILCGLVFQRAGAILWALLTSVCFSFLIVMGPTLGGTTLFLTVGFNNLAFFAVALLSGYLSEQLNFMGSEIRARDQDIRTLKNINEMIIDNIGTGLMTVDTEGLVLHYNPAAKKILGFAEGFADENLEKFFPEIYNRVKSYQFLKNSSLGRFEIIYVNKKSERLLLGCSVSPLFEAPEILSGYILIFQDLTEIKRLERTIQRSEKLVAVGKLAAGIAHEIRNPLASISGSIQLLKSSSTRTHEEDRLMSIVLREIDRLNLLISEFLDFARPEQEIEKVVDLELVIKEVLDMARVNTKLRQNVEQKTSFKNGRKLIGNPDKLKQVFLNLIINAYHAVEKSANPCITVSTSFERGLVCVHVQDNGVGMNDGVIKRLFEPFFTTKSQGTGLGLATTHKILENHEARIFVESVEGRGSDFALEFTKLAPQEKSVDNKTTTHQRGHG